MKNNAIAVFFRLLALFFFGLGVIGIFVPGLPTIPFVILAAWATSKGWPVFEAWLLNHAYFSRYIKDWRTHRRIPHRAKIYAAAMMLISTVYLVGAETIFCYSRS